ncbi:MAG TPA: GNAT family N-acetyltransferase [Terriglobales bacterium]|nr:GNAT family N-acetyltransferase [Terriglobales bacterium]
MLRIRSLKLEDVPLLRQMIFELATYERLAHEVTINEEMLARDAFGSQPRFRALLSDWDGAPAGYAIFFPVYSTFQGPSLFLADIYVRERFRAKGIGKALMAEVAAIALREDLRALRWEVLGWNLPSINFYKSLGAVFLSDWKEVLLEGESLSRLAESASR